MLTVQKTLVILCSFFCLLSKSYIVSGEAIVENCKSLVAEKILEGCSLFKGLSIKSQGGTVVNATNCDVLLPKKVFEKEPGIHFPSADDGKLYTLVVVDPDVKDHLPGFAFLHGLKSNIKGADLKKGCTCLGTGIQPYLGPGPPKGSGIHRYMFLAYEQEKEILESKATKRMRFNYVQWAKDNHLCGPKGGVQFRALFEI